MTRPTALSQILTTLPLRMSMSTSSTGLPRIIHTQTSPLENPLDLTIGNTQSVKLFTSGQTSKRRFNLIVLLLFAPSFLREFVYQVQGQVLTTPTHHRYAPPMQALLKTQTYNALFNETLLASYFPNIHMFYFACASTCWFCVWAYMETSRLYKETIKQGSTARTMSFYLVDDANHFVSAVNCSLTRRILGKCQL
jgi:hypothetical protein